MELEIEGLLDEGWKPRIKKRKKLRYITLRKGNQEKSLGPYTEELWNKVKPVDPWATPAQISDLEKRLSNIERSKRDPSPSLDSLLLKRIKKLEEVQQRSNSSLLEKRITQLEESQRGSKPYLLKRRINKLEDTQREDTRIRNSSITDFGKMREALIESAKRRQWEHYACKKINPKGYCLEWWYGKGEIPKYIRPVAWGEHEGKKVYYINVRENPIVCSACPDYEPKS